MTSTCQQNYTKSFVPGEKEENMYDLTVTIVPADGEALWDARTFAGMVVINFLSPICKGATL